MFIGIQVALLSGGRRNGLEILMREVCEMLEKLGKLVRFGDIAERFTYRVQDDVQIFEHEEFYTRTPSSREDALCGMLVHESAAPVTEPAGPTRLVVEDDADSSLITRARSEISGLNALLLKLRGQEQG